MGTWYEIPNIPINFKKSVCRDPGQYRLQANGTVQVTNRCKTEERYFDEAIGEARQILPSASSKLQVRFAPLAVVVPIVWGNYWVIDLDPAYQLVAVSEPEREYLWVLSRTPAVSAERMERYWRGSKYRGSIWTAWKTEADPVAGPQAK